MNEVMNNHSLYVKYEKYVNYMFCKLSENEVYAKMKFM